MTLSELAALVEKHRDREVILVDHDEWMQLRRHIGLEFVVSATAERPLFFWFMDKKIATPAYVIAQSQEVLHEA